VRRPIVLILIIIGLLLLGSLLWFSPTRVYCLRTYPPPTWENPPIPPTAKEVSITVADRREEESTLLKQDDGPTILHKIVTYTVAPGTYDRDQFLFWSLVRDCWEFQWRTSPGVGGISDVDHRFKWASIGSNRFYFYDMVTRKLPTGDIQVIIHTRRTVDE
jgi:hypothetical protein